MEELKRVGAGDNHINLYDDTGYLNIAGIFSYGTIFNFIVGGRGTGKTYGMLSYLYDSGKTAIYLRRTQAQADIIGKADFTPFKAVANDRHIDYEVLKVVKGVTAVYVDGRPLYYTAALSTFASLRSFDMSDVSYILFDEFIPERSERVTIKHEFDAFLNMYETVNRNRELQGRPPVILLAAANANDINNKIFMGLGLIAVTDGMMKKGQEEWHDMKRSISLYYPQRSPISSAKRETALYKLSQGTDFEKMSIQNDYNLDISDILRRPAVEYKPVVNVGELCVRRHKARTDEYLITVGIAKDSAPYYPATERGIGQFKERYPRIVYNYLFSDSFYYGSLLAKSLFTAYMQDY